MSPDTQTHAHTDLVVDVGPVAHGGHCAVSYTHLTLPTTPYV